MFVTPSGMVMLVSPVPENAPLPMVVSRLTGSNVTVASDVMFANA